MSEAEERLLTPEQLEATIKQSRNNALISMINGPTVLPHILLNFTSMLHGVAQATAVVLTEEGCNGGVTIDGNCIVPNEIINDDHIAFAALLMIRVHRMTSNGLITEMTPNIVSEVFLDFKKLKGREPNGISKHLHEVANLSVDLPHPTTNQIGEMKH